MLVGGILLGLLLGLVLGGKIERLADIRLQYLPLLFIAVIIRFGTEALLGMGVGFVDVLRIPLFGLSYGLLLFTLWHNRTYPGLALAFVGIALNGLVIMVNGGRMPVWMDAYAFAGLTGPLNSVLHVPLYEVNAEFFLRLGPLADVIPLPIPPFQNVASIGDLFLSAGLGFFLFATLLRSPAEAQRALDEAREDRLLGVAGTARLRAPGTGIRPTAPGAPIPASTGLSPALEETAALERPLLLGSASTGQAAPTYGRLPDGTLVPTTIEAAPRRRLPTLTRIRRHPYVRLALNGSFSALWVGQLISMFGDRVNQLALLYFVYATTNSPLQVALVFVAGSLPNLLFSPVAGALVDRWDQKQVLVVSDILRAALVLLVPVTISINVWIAYVIVFLITTVSIFFRPARIAILPRLVDDTDLLPANSAMWVGETIADVVNYPIAGLFVLFLGSSAALAFWFDAVTYLASAGLLATMVVPPIVRRTRSPSAVGRLDDQLEPEPEAGGVPSVADVRRDLQEGWAFLRTEAVLLANTVQSTVAQLAVGVVTGLGFLIAYEVNPATQTATFAFMETAIGIGNLLGGFALGLITARIAKGRLIIAAYTAFGVLVFFVGFIPPLPIMLALMFGIGIANMAFVIPSQTLFQERTPPELMARVVSFRFAIVFGVMTIATGALGLVANVTGVGPVVALAGVIAIVAGVAGYFVPAIRDA